MKMTIIAKLRIFHTVLAVVALLTFATGEAGPVHDWLGYGLAGLIVFRLAWAVVGPRHVGLARLVPDLTGFFAKRWYNHPAIGRLLLLGIIANLLVATATGFALDDRTLGAMAGRLGAVQMPAVIIEAQADEGGEGEMAREGWLAELHEGSSELMLVFVALHTGFILLWRTKLGLFMLYLGGATRRRKTLRASE